MLHRLKGRLGWKLAMVGLVLGLGVSQTSTAAEELRIGFLAPLTGGFAQVGKDMTNGFQLPGRGRRQFRGRQGEVHCGGYRGEAAGRCAQG